MALQQRPWDELKGQMRRASNVQQPERVPGSQGCEAELNQVTVVLVVNEHGIVTGSELRESTGCQPPLSTLDQGQGLLSETNQSKAARRARPKGGAEAQKQKSDHGRGRDR
ncbi:hypothetical protein H8959_004822 [Pygathrix nigripes]